MGNTHVYVAGGVVVVVAVAVVVSNLLVYWRVVYTSRTYGSLLALWTTVGFYMVYSCVELKKLFVMRSSTTLYNCTRTHTHKGRVSFRIACTSICTA